jgi:hypothetical protein
MHSIADLNQFESEWTQLAQEICTAIMKVPEITQLKNNLLERGHLTPEEKSNFINIADKVKYDLIFERYGDINSESFQNFRGFWQKWLKVKGVGSAKIETKRQETIDHFLYGSTPDPETFLREFN